VDLAELDDLFSRYRDAERRIGANLVELDANPTLKMLAAGRPSGETAERFGAAIASAASLWHDFELVRRTLADAEAVRGTSRRPPDSAAAELERMLTTPSIERGRADVALTDRTLLGSSVSTTMVTLDELLAIMNTTYEGVCEAVAAVEQIWSRAVPRLDAARRAMGPLRERAAVIEVLAEPALDTLDRLIVDVERRLGDDPVALSDSSLEALDAALDLARSRVAELQVAHDNFERDLEQARGLLGVLTENLNAVRESYARVSERIVSPTGVADLTEADVAAYRALRAEAAAVLTAEHDRGIHWRTRRAKLDSWAARATALDGRFRAVTAANVAPEAKAAARRRIERPQIIDRLRAARAEAGRAPCDLDRLNALLDALARDLSTKDG